MTTWEHLGDHMRSHYELLSDDDESIVLTFELAGGRTQTVFLFRQTLLRGTEEWVAIHSPIGELSSIDLPRALHEVGRLVVGGLSVMGNNHLTVKHSAPLADMSLPELERPMALICSAADELEELLTGFDLH